MDSEPATVDAGTMPGSVDAAIDAPERRDIAAPDLSPAADRSVDRASDAAPADRVPPSDAPAEAPASSIVVLVVGNPAVLEAGDNRLRTAIAAKGFSIRLVDDDAAAVSVAGVRLVVLASSSQSINLGAKYRDVTVPLINAEPSVYDALGMTAATTADLGDTTGQMLTILAPEHPMAAGLSGTVSVVSVPTSMGWGRPSASAERVAVLQGLPDQTAVFGYAAGAMMTVGRAPARRVGLFATESAAGNLSDDGVRLVSAAIDWALLP